MNRVGKPRRRLSCTIVLGFHFLYSLLFCLWCVFPLTVTQKVRKNGEACHTIDYIFVSEGVQVKSCLSIPDKQTLPRERIPSWVYPSDHLSIGADVLLWPEKV